MNFNVSQLPFALPDSSLEENILEDKNYILEIFVTPDARIVFGEEQMINN